MKHILMKLVKYYKPLYFFYYWIGSLILHIVKFFVIPKNNLILFISFGGKKFDDSPKAIYDEMIKDYRFDQYDLVWAFQNPDDYIIPRGRKIKTDTFEYYITALKARCWISNSSVERGLNFKGRNTFYLNTWHGTPIKKMGTDIPHNNKSFKSKARLKVDIMTAQSNYEANIFSKVFKIDRKKIEVCGLPRNDKLVNVSMEKKHGIMEKLGLPLDKKVILYAPTYREYNIDRRLKYTIAPPIDFVKWKKEIGDKYIVLFRSHYEVSRAFTLEADNNFLFDMSKYPNLNDLMIASDLLISDYSSIFFDYSILEKPMICYAYDYEEYKSKRGLYFDIRKEILGGSITEIELLEIIKHLNYEQAIEMVRNFRKKYVESYGNATKTCLEIIYKNISHDYRS